MRRGGVKAASRGCRGGGVEPLDVHAHVHSVEGLRWCVEGVKGYIKGDVEGLSRDASRVRRGCVEGASRFASRFASRASRPGLKLFERIR